MRRGLTILLGAFMFLCNFSITTAQGDKIQDMFRIRVNGASKVLDSQSTATLLSEINTYLGQESIVIQPRKADRPVQYSWAIGKLNNPKTNLPTMIRVVVNGKTVIDSQVRKKLTSVIMDAVRSGKKVKVSPRAVYQKEVEVQALVQDIVQSAKQGQLPGSRQIAVGSTGDEVRSIFTDRPTKIEFALTPNILEVTYPKKNGSKGAFDQILFGFADAEDEVVYMITSVADPDKSISGHDIFKVLGKPIKSHKDISLTEPTKKAGKPLPPGTIKFTIYVFKAGAYNLYFVEIPYTLPSKGVSIKTMSACVDKNGEALLFIQQN